MTAEELIRDMLNCYDDTKSKETIMELYAPRLERWAQNKTAEPKKEELQESAMISPRKWTEFRKTGLLLIVNQFLHVFGWAIIVQIKNDRVINATPARVKFRGFDNKDTEEAHKKVSKYMLENAKELNKEANE